MNYSPEQSRIVLLKGSKGPVNSLSFPCGYYESFAEILCFSLSCERKRKNNENSAAFQRGPTNCTFDPGISSLLTMSDAS